LSQKRFRASGIVGGGGYCGLMEHDGSHFEQPGTDPAGPRRMPRSRRWRWSNKPYRVPHGQRQIRSRCAVLSDGSAQLILVLVVDHTGVYLKAVGEVLDVFIS
jgi:hypothetical protein